MLCSRSASLIIRTRRSRAIATSILRKFSAWPLLTGGERELADLGDAVHQLGDLLAELALEILLGGGGVFQDVVEQARPSPW
jgi:hypothetical protein